MAQTRPNKMVTITNDEVYDLSTHLARMADSATVVIPVNTATERDAIPKYAGLTVRRLDVSGHPLEEWDGATWNRSDIVTSSAGVTDAFFDMTGGLMKKVSPTGFTQVTMSLNITRKTAAIGIGTGDTTVLLNMIPAGYRPSLNHYFISTINTNVGARYAEPQWVIDSTGGSLVARSTSGGSITMGVGFTAFLTTTWFI